MIPKAELAFLAGLPLVPVTAVVHSLFHAASDPSGVGHMYVLPDDHDPYVATWEEYEPFSPIWAQKLDDRTRRYKWVLIRARLTLDRLDLLRFDSGGNWRGIASDWVWRDLLSVEYW